MIYIYKFFYSYIFLFSIQTYLATTKFIQLCREAVVAAAALGPRLPSRASHASPTHAASSHALLVADPGQAEEAGHQQPRQHPGFPRQQFIDILIIVLFAYLWVNARTLEYILKSLG